MKYHLTPVSSNSKTGPIAVSTTSKDSCPPSCELINKGCYANSGPLAIHWLKVSEGSRGVSLDVFIDKLKRTLSAGQLFRHNQSGDIPGLGELVDTNALELIRKTVKAAKAIGFTYSHKKSKDALQAIKENNLRGGLLVNVSAKNLTEASSIFKQGMDVVSIIPKDSPKVSKTDCGIRVITCPAQTVNKVTCNMCRLCAKPNRKYIIGFKPHGVFSNHVETLLKQATT